MNFKKRVNGSWTDISHYIHKTDTDTVTTLPAVIHPTGTTATVGLKGQTLQSSIPSPTTPIQPQGCGERTGNLLDYTTVESASYATATLISGGITISGRYYVQFSSVNFTIGSSYTMSWTAEPISGTVRVMWRFRYSDNTFSSMPSSGMSLVAEKEVVALLLYVNGTSTESGVAEITNIMLNLGSTALPYEPYGYKIPISSADTTTNIYLGEVETTRKIKELVLTGNETPTVAAVITDTNAYQFPNEVSDYKREPFICSHMVVNNESATTNTHGYIGQRLTLCFDKAMGLDTTDKVKTYLAEQYSNGTPVTVWYVLATPQTAVVNEPLMKIGDYADTVSGITIPTIAGSDTLSIDTTLQPSEVTVNYKGWHSAIVHERTNGTWT